MKQITVLIAMAAAVGLIALGGFAIREAIVRYGTERYNAGIIFADARTTKVLEDAVAKDKQDWKDDEDETARMSDDDVDRDNIRLGIMRDDADR